MKKFLIVLLAIIVFVFCLGLIKDQALKSIITVIAADVTGAPVHMDGFSLGLLNQTVRVKGFKLFNPQGFSQDILLDLPKANVSYDVGALLKKKIHIANVEIELKEMLLEKNKEGQLNVDRLKVARQEKKEEKKPEKKPSAAMPLQIDTLRLDIGRIISVDDSKGKHSVLVYDINLHKTYKNISSPQQLTALILTEPMKAAGIQGAKIYGAAMLAGVAVLPVALAATFAGKDSTQHDFMTTRAYAYDTCVDILKTMGKISNDNKTQGVIAAEIDGANVNLKINEKPDKKINIAVSARKYLMPKPEIAAGVLYLIEKKMEPHTG